MNKRPEAFKAPEFAQGIMEMSTYDVLKEIFDRLFPPVPEELKFIVDSKQPIIILEAGRLKEARWLVGTMLAHLEKQKPNVTSQ